VTPIWASHFWTAVAANSGPLSDLIVAGGLVDDRKDAELATVMGAALDEVISPDVTGIFWAKPDA